MISAQEATQIINSHLFSFPTEVVSLDQAHGRVLRETIRADRDFPPFDRVTMDGIAYNFEHLEFNPPEFVIDGLQLAGEPRKALSHSGQCLEAMTGAVLPEGTNTVTPYEDISIQERDGKKIAIIQKMPPEKGLNVHAQGFDRSQGEVLLEAGSLMGPAQIAIAASVGKAQITVASPPKVAIVSTGDELVKVHETPAPHQIRQSNNYALKAALQNFHITADFFHLPDSLEKTTAGLADIMKEYPVVILSGGVSRGKRDHVPDALEALGVEKLFHRVKQRPAKPFWFGTKAKQSAVFALPGNPVSTFLCFHRYFLPWLEKSLGLTEKKPQWATLNDNLKFEPELTYFLQVRAQADETGQFSAMPIEGHGSGDFANLLQCNGFLELPADRSHFRQGEVFPFIPFVS